MSRRLALWIGLDRVATLVSEIISRSIPSGGRSRSHALRCDRHALIMQMSLGLVRAAVNERCTCIRVPSSGETSGLRVDYDIRARVCVCNQRVCTRYPINFSFASQFSSCSRYEMIERYLVSSRVKLFFFSTEIRYVYTFHWWEEVSRDDTRARGVFRYLHIRLKFPTPRVTR